MTVPRFGRVVTAMVTPFDQRGALDLDGAAELARWLADHGSDALVVAGTTGEGPVLSDEECIDLWRAVAEAVTVPVVAGTGTNDTAHSVAMTRAAQDAGVDGVLVVTPYYNRPSQAGLNGHFRAVAAATDLPVILYDIPVRTGRRISTDLLVSLGRDVANIVGVKDAVGDAPAAARVVEATPESFELYSGDDAMTLPLLAVGAVGVVSVASNWAGPLMARLVEAFVRGDIDGARAANRLLFDSYDFESSEDHPNPEPAKAAVRALGLPAGQCRLPNAPATAELDARAGAVVATVTADAGGASVG